MTKNVPDGLIMLNKQPGLTSFESLAEIKRAIGSGKAGHTGTLDKFAQGLLLVLTGRALKLANWFSGCDKQYEARIRFGIETDTLDPEGATIAEAALPSLSDFEAILPQFRGEILQAPPAYSAIHIAGKRASALARSGAAPEMQKRPVHIFALDLLEWQPPEARVFVHCSSGTYIRSLARDLALAAGSRAHLTALTRIQIAGFSLEAATEPATEAASQPASEPASEAASQPASEPASEAASEAASQPASLKPIDKSVFQALGIPWFELESAAAEPIIHGKPLAGILRSAKPLYTGLYTLPPGAVPSQSAAVFCGESFAAMVEKTPEGWKYAHVH